MQMMRASFLIALFCLAPPAGGPEQTITVASWDLEGFPHDGSETRLDHLVFLVRHVMNADVVNFASLYLGTASWAGLEKRMAVAGYKYQATWHGPSTSVVFYRSPRLRLVSSMTSSVPTTVTMPGCRAEGQGRPVYLNLRLGEDLFTVTNVHWIAASNPNCPQKESVAPARRLTAKLRFDFVRARLESRADPGQVENEETINYPISQNLILVGQMGGAESDDALLPFRGYGFVLWTEPSRLNPSSGKGSYRENDQVVPLQHILASPAIAEKMVPNSGYYLPSYSEFSGLDLAAFKSEVTEHAPVWAKFRLP